MTFMNDIVFKRIPACKHSAVISQKYDVIVLPSVGVVLVVGVVVVVVVVVIFVVVVVVVVVVKQMSLN